MKARWADILWKILVAGWMGLIPGISYGAADSPLGLDELLHEGKLIEMPYYEQPGGTCWATSAKMFSRAFYPNDDGGRKALTVYGLMKKLNLGIDDGLPGTRRVDLARAIGKGTTASIFFSKESLKQKMLELLDRGHPVIFSRNAHVVLAVGYRYVNGELEIIYHNPQGKMYERQLFSKMKLDSVYQNYKNYDLVLWWSPNTPHKKRTLLTVGLPSYGKSSEGVLCFEKKKGKRVTCRYFLKFDSHEGYRWSAFGRGREDGKLDTDIRYLKFELPVYNSSAKSDEVCLTVTVREKQRFGHRVWKSVVKTIPGRKRRILKGRVDLRRLLEGIGTKDEVEGVVDITLRTGKGNFFHRVDRYELGHFTMRAAPPHTCPKKLTREFIENPYIHFYGNGWRIVLKDRNVTDSRGRRLSDQLKCEYYGMEQGHYREGLPLRRLSKMIFDSARYSWTINYYKNGKRRHVAIYRYNPRQKKMLNDRYSKTFYPSGKLSAYVEYKNGRKHGRSIRFYPNGQKKFEMSYRNGKLHGKEIYYNQNGSIYSIRIWENGKSKSINYYENGKPLRRRQ